MCVVQHLFLALWKSSRQGPRQNLPPGGIPVLSSSRNRARHRCRNAAHDDLEMPLTMLSSRRSRWLRVRAHDDLELAFTLPRNMQSAELGSADVHSGQETDRGATLDRQSGGTASGVCESPTDQGNLRQASAAEEGRVDRAEFCALLRYRRNAQDTSARAALLSACAPSNFVFLFSRAQSVSEPALSPI